MPIAVQMMVEDPSPSPSPSPAGTHRIMLYQPTSVVAGLLKVFDWSTSNLQWEQVGNTLTVSDFGSVNIDGLAAITEFRVVATGAGILRAYDFDETDIAQVGNDGSFGSVQTVCCALGESSFVASSRTLVDWAGFAEVSFDGTDFTVGITYQFGFPENSIRWVAGLTASAIALVRNGDHALGKWDLNGSWAIDGSEVTTPLDANLPQAWDSLTTARIVNLNAGAEIQAYDRGASAFASVGNALDYNGTGYGVASLAEDTIAVVYRTASTSVEVTPPIVFDGVDWVEQSGDALVLPDTTLVHCITCMTYRAPRGM